MKLALVLAAFLCVTWGMKFQCSSGFENDDEQKDSTTVDQATCCIEKAPVVNCMADETDQTPFDCEEGTMMKERMGTPYMRDKKFVRSQDSCCFTITCYNPAYECPSGKSPIAWSRDVPDTAPSEANCCEYTPEYTPAFVADCGHITAEAVYNWMGEEIHPFCCGEGTTFNRTASPVTSPDQAKCCEPYNATCNRASGTMFNPKPFACPSGQNLDFTELLAANDANCCSPYTKSCAQINDAGDVYQCPVGKTLKLDEDGQPSDEDPSDANCCQSITCGDLRYTCADWTSDINGPSLCQSRNSITDPAAASKVISGSQELNVHLRLCCKDRIPPCADKNPTAPSEGSFSGAGTRAPTLLAAVALLLALATVQ